MKNPIGKCNMFATPESMENLENWLTGVSKSNTGTGPFIVTAAFMAWNLASETVKAEIEAEAEAKAALNYNTPAAYRARMNGGEK